jgi:hypothetical protein
MVFEKLRKNLDFSNSWVFLMQISISLKYIKYIIYLIASMSSSCM